MPPKKKLILPDRIDQTSAESTINELNKIKEYAKLVGWDITFSSLIWNTKSSFELQLYGKRCRVPIIEMQATKLIKKKTKVKFSMKGKKHG